MDWKLEVIVLPVADVARSRKFYTDQLGFSLDVDHEVREGTHIVQVTPPGSACSVTFGTGLTESEPGSVKGLQLVVADIEAAHAHLVERGVDVTEVRHVTETGEWAPGQGGPWNSFCFFADPDGNGWGVQQRPPAG
ncbi:VOC family protein [Pseudonocardia sp.]|jgi:catechol 2,3-dioxygenase-like lactoylglutathione lyase family enzyme|uniref:VOC family protein n=1 Tax=Pseudonocardia sp. TaxID=60912 RepID=UPI003D139CFC